MVHLSKPLAITLICRKEHKNSIQLMHQRRSTLSLLKKWIILHGTLWPVSFLLNWVLVFILFDGLGAMGLYSSCPSTIAAPSPTSPLQISNPCIQRWLALEFFFIGIIVGRGVGFVQWRITLRQLNLPQRWIDMNTISWAVGGPVVYLVYGLYLRNFPFLPFQSRLLPEVVVFTWAFIVSELISCAGEQWVLDKHWRKPSYWLLSNLLGIIGAGLVDLFLSQWLPAIWYVGLFVGVTSGLALWHGAKISTE